MVKLTGPLMSIEATGTLGKLLTYNQQPRGCTLRRKPQPKHPRTGAQVAVQSALTFVTQQWAGLNQAEKDSWVDADFVDGVSAYTNYVKFNCQRIRSLLPPVVDYPLGPVRNYCQGYARQAVGGNRKVELEWQCFAALAQTYGLFIFREERMWARAWFQNLVHVGVMRDALPQTHTDAPIAAGTYGYRWEAFSAYGRLSGPAYNNNVIVTDT